MFSPASLEPLKLPSDGQRWSEIQTLTHRLKHASSERYHSITDEKRRDLLAFLPCVNAHHSHNIENQHIPPTRLWNLYTGAERPLSDEERSALDHCIAENKNFSGTLRDTICAVHASLFSGLPKTEPGQFRSHDVRVGHHIPIEAQNVPEFMDHLSQRYNTPELHNIAALHHRLLWIHPFLDGNGRTARFYTQHMISTHLDHPIFWSFSRAMDRHTQRYTSGLRSCDTLRQGTLDGRGTLSTKALEEFTLFVLEACLEEIHST